ncbi:MAG TPA: SDR family NAD(P)-dependent oxidoreductase [Ilumatobacteraceae bacterium]|nr:SDR family NAD(P)-dependent oxidoreductase [Ilumatobacteraceae bacterium]
MDNVNAGAVAVVTGASTGIGEATALRLARDGYRVVATMRRPEVSGLPDIASAESLHIDVAALDVDSDESVAGLFADVVERLGPVEVLVANAGVGGNGGPMESASLDVFRSTMETNFFGAIRCVKAVLVPMRERGAGTIVAVTSQAGRLAPPTMPAYVASKWALEGAMESLAGSVAPFGVRVAIIEPGCILTPIFSKAAEGEQPAVPAPYQPQIDAFLTGLFHDLARGDDPSVVADCIAEAITTDDPRLRYLVGQGAGRNIAVRASLTDEEYIGLNLLSADEQMAIQLAGEA